MQRVLQSSRGKDRAGGGRMWLRSGDADQGKRVSREKKKEGGLLLKHGNQPYLSLELGKVVLYAPQKKRTHHPPALKRGKNVTHPRNGRRKRPCRRQLLSLSQQKRRMLPDGLGEKEDTTVSDGDRASVDSFQVPAQGKGGIMCSPGKRQLRGEKGRSEETNRSNAQRWKGESRPRCRQAPRHRRGKKKPPSE